MSNINDNINTELDNQVLSKKPKKPAKNRMLNGVFIIAMATVISKIIGAVYRIPLINILGAEGMGIYQLVFPVFVLFMTLSTSGIPTALARIVAEKRAKNENAKRYLGYTMLLLLVLSSIATVLMIGLSEVFATMQGNSQSTFGYILIAPSLLFVSIVTGLRGWFQGEMYMTPTAISNILEQVVKLVAGLSLAVLFKPQGVIYSVMGAILGVTISEFVAMIYLLIVYFVRGRNNKEKYLKLEKTERRDVTKIALPIAIVSLIFPLSAFFDSMIIVNVLKWTGSTTMSATADFGLLSGTVNSLLNMPIVVIMSLAVVIIPAVTMSRMDRDIFGIMKKSSVSVKLTYLIGIPTAFFVLIFAGEMLQIFYPTLTSNQLEIATNLMMTMAFNIVFLSVMQIYVSLLLALDRTKYAVLSLALAVILKIVLNVVLVKFMGILGAGIASLVMSVFAMLGVGFSFYRITNFNLTKNVLSNFLAGGVVALICYGLKFAIQNRIVVIVVGFFVYFVVYLLVVLLFNIVEKDDIKYMPFAKYLFKVRAVVRFWENDNHDKTD